MNARAGASLSVVALLAAASATGQVITVNTSSDVVDFGGAQTVAQLPGPDGKVSLREAGIASDSTPGVQTIAFGAAFKRILRCGGPAQLQ